MEISRSYPHRRRPLVVGNWKMNGLVETALDMGEALRTGLDERDNLCEVVVCPPFTTLYALHQQLGDSTVKLGAQNMYAAESGAFTGEIGGIMLRNVGCRYVIIGHSERRTLFYEDNDLVIRKMLAAFRDGLHPILCLGETLEQREAGQTLAVLSSQLEPALQTIRGYKEKRGQLVLAYEPVWAIGTGHHATPVQAQEIHQFLRGLMGEHFDEECSQRIRIIYGGSVKPDNAAALFAQPDIDGALVGGASLQSNDFLAIIDALPPII